MAKPKLCEIIAVVSGKKGEVEKFVTDNHHKLQKKELFEGLNKTYRPKDEAGEVLPSESKQPQMRAKELIAETAKKWTELFDLIFTLDAGNCEARGDVVVDEKVIAKSIPVTSLLFLEKQLEHVHTFIMKLPMPDPAEVWTYDSAQDMLTTGVRTTVHTKKVQEPLVLSPATKEHPAQTTLITKDVSAGDWNRTLFTTAIPAKERNEMLERVSKLRDAVKVARERANSIEVEKKKMGEDILGFVFGSNTQKK